MYSRYNKKYGLNGVHKLGYLGILEDVISGGAAADFVEPMPEGKIKRQEKNKKDRKGKKDEGDDFSSGNFSLSPSLLSKIFRNL